jgi:hypothetical protein
VLAPRTQPSRHVVRLYGARYALMPTRSVLRMRARPDGTHGEGTERGEGGGGSLETARATEGQSGRRRGSGARPWREASALLVRCPAAAASGSASWLRLAGGLTGQTD